MINFLKTATILDTIGCYKLADKFTKVAIDKSDLDFDAVYKNPETQQKLLDIQGTYKVTYGNQQNVDKNAVSKTEFVSVEGATKNQIQTRTFHAPSAILRGIITAAMATFFIQFTVITSSASDAHGADDEDGSLKHYLKDILPSWSYALQIFQYIFLAIVVVSGLVLLIQKTLEWFGVVTAIIYSMLVASNTGYEVLGFTLLFISALAIGLWALLCKHYGILLLQFFYASAGVIGVWRWL